MPFRAPDRVGTTPQGRGRFPGFDVLDQVDTWDNVTAGVVLARLQPASELSFFSDVESAIARTLCDLLLAQDGEPRIPVVALIDARLAAGETDGWRYADLPPDGQAWRDSLHALDEDARSSHHRPWSELSADQQVGIVQAVWQADHDGGQWHGWRASHVWSLWSRYACAAFYSHPWAWNEIGFGGPAYPRGYKNIGLDSAEPWEVDDRDDSDPVTFAERVERARTEHAGLTGHDAAARGRTPAPSDGTR